MKQEITFWIAAIIAIIAMSAKTASQTKLEAEQEVGDLTGYYTCQGTESTGKKYSGITAIAKIGNIYIVTWAIGQGSSYQGVGLRTNHQLAVSWSLQRQGVAIQGVNLYRIENKKLVGRWVSLPGTGQVASESLTFLKDMEKDDE